MNTPTTVAIHDGPLDHQGRPIQIVELSNQHLTLRMLSLGATMWQLFPTGGTEDDSWCLFHASPADYLDNRPYFGAFVGPVANRIGGSSFELDGARYDLTPNEGPHHLHGGPDGWSNLQWSVSVLDGGVRFQLDRSDGDGGYPGNRAIAADWLLDGPRITNIWTATSDRITLVSPTNHAYWNLGGARPDNSLNVLDHRVEIPASELVTVDDELIPTGVLAPVGTRDARSAPSIGDLVAANEPGIDQSYVLDGAGPIRLFGPEGRSLSITTTLPAVQLYTGQYLSNADTNGRYGPYGGVCLETQYLPDAVHHAGFDTPIVGPDQPISHTTTWQFSL